VKNAGKMKVLGGLAILGAGLLLNGCKHVPDFTAANAQALIQADYDSKRLRARLSKSTIGLEAGVDGQLLEADEGLSQQNVGRLHAHGRWQEGVDASRGRRRDQWRPDQIASASPHFYVVTMAAKPFKAKDVQDPQDEVLPGVGNG